MEKVLKRVIGEYVENIDVSNVSVVSGVVDLQNLKLKKDICDRINIPLRLILGRMKKLYLKVPWNALSSKPVQLIIDGLDLVVEPLE